MRTLIIGGTGLISTSVTGALLERGHEVWHLNRGRTEAGRGVRTLRCDRTDHAAFESLVRAQKPFNCIIDMVGYTPEDARSLARASVGRAVQVIFCSTVDVYSKRGALYPQREGSRREGRNSYGKQKVECEQILEAGAREGQFALTILRPAQTYRDPSLILHAFGFGLFWADRLRRGLPILVHGDGTSPWCVAHADDVAQPFAAAVGLERAFNKSYNVAGDEVLAWNDFYRQAAEVADAPEPNLVHIPTDFLMQAAPKEAAIVAQNFRHPNIFDNSAARQDLGFKQSIFFRHGFERGWKWHLEQDKIPRAEDDPSAHDSVLDVWRKMRAQALAEAAQA